jgi:hypothetical protein
MTPSEWLRRVAAVEATPLRSKRIPLNILVVNDPDAGLEEYRLPDDVVEKLRTIKIGRSDSSDEVESGRQWGGEADGSRAWAAYVAWTPGNISIHRAGDVKDRSVAWLSGHVRRVVGGHSALPRCRRPARKLLLQI